MRSFTGLSLLLTTVFFTATPLVSSADVYEDGMVAYHSGRYHDALGIWKWLAETGNADAKFNLGFMYEFGYGVPVDEAAALSWYQSAAEAGHEQAQRYVAWMYEHGKGVVINKTESRRWMRIAESNAISSGASQELELQQAMFDRLCAELVEAETRHDRLLNQPPVEPRQLEASAQTS